MCRHLAYVGTPRTLHQLLIEPDWSLVRQSYEPRRQRFGKVNADGFGAGWYIDDDPAPVRYRRDRPIWSDESFHDIARVTSSRAVLAAVRSATEGTAHGVEAVAPFATGRYLFSHNGRVEGWPTSVTGLADKLPTSALLDLVARTDSALLWAHTQEALTAGLSADRALAMTVRQTAQLAEGRFNLLLHDGQSIVGARYGETLYYRQLVDGVIVASEPTDDEHWTEVPDHSVVVATVDDVLVAPIEGSTP